MNEEERKRSVSKLKKWATWTVIEHGVTQVSVMSEEWIGPLGFAWGLHLGSDQDGASSFTIIDCYVPRSFRRCGILTLIHSTIFDKLGCSVIRTGGGSEDGGLEFLKASGYTFDDKVGLWYITKERWGRLHRLNMSNLRP